MSFVNVTEQGCVEVRPTAVYLADRVESRRFMLASLASFVLLAFLLGFVGNFSGAEKMKAAINVISHMLQSLI